MGLHSLALYFLAFAMEWLVRLTHPPCGYDGLCNNFACLLLWMTAVVGVGHFFAEAVATWSPLKIPKRTRPPLWQYLRDPDAWMQEEDDRPTFHPDPLLFPALWQPLRILQFLLVAKEMMHDADTMHSLMQLWLVQQACREEWYRVLMVERRVGLAILPMSGYLIFSLRLVAQICSVSSLSTLLLVPYVLSVLISTWINVLIYFEGPPPQAVEVSGSSIDELWGK
jgi:tryptophan-rich sensory protein